MRITTRKPIVERGFPCLFIKNSRDSTLVPTFMPNRSFPLVPSPLTHKHALVSLKIPTNSFSFRKIPITFQQIVSKVVQGYQFWNKSKYVLSCGTNEGVSSNLLPPPSGTTNKRSSQLHYSFVVPITVTMVTMVEATTVAINYVHLPLCKIWTEEL